MVQRAEAMLVGCFNYLIGMDNLGINSFLPSPIYLIHPSRKGDVMEVCLLLCCIW